MNLRVRSLTLSAALGAMNCGEPSAPVNPDAGVVDAMLDGGPSAPTAASIMFAAGAKLGAGSYLVFNDWSKDPNSVWAVAVGDVGGARTELFRANRVWSLGTKADGSAMLFAAHDDQQEAHFGVTLGDSIQNTFLFDAASQQVRAVAWGNINDECHTFTPDGLATFVCRRYDFTSAGTFSGWRLAKVRLADGVAEYVRAEQTRDFELSPQPLSNQRLLFELRSKPPASNSAIYVRDLTTGVETKVFDQASRPVLAPDGHHITMLNHADGRKLYIADLDAPTAPLRAVPASAGAADVVWAPDGNSLFYTVFDSANSCDHIERINLLGTPAPTPERLRDCVSHNHEFITKMFWVTVP